MDEILNTEVGEVVPSVSEQVTAAEELREKGKVILKADTREELAEMVNNLPADTKYAAGAIGRSREDGKFYLQVDIIKNQ